MISGILFWRVDEKKLKAILTSTLGNVILLLCKENLAHMLGGTDMNKEEILEKSRQENRGGDEREQMLSTKAKAFGFLGMGIMVIVLFCIKIARNESVYDLFAVYCSFFAVSDMLQYHFLRKKIHLWMAILSVFAAIVFFILYVWKG